MGVRRRVPTARLCAVVPGAVIGVLLLATSSSAAQVAPAGKPVVTVAGIAVYDPYVPLPTSTTDAVVYCTFANRSNKAVAVISAASNVSSSAMPMKEVLQGQTEVMVPAQQLTVPAHGTLTLAPGGYHVMLMGLTKTLGVGDHVGVTLGFSNGKQVLLSVPVVSLAQAFGHGGVTSAQSASKSKKATGSTKKGSVEKSPTSPTSPTMNMKGMKSMKGMG